jgi:hypothetical protein
MPSPSLTPGQRPIYSGERTKMMKEIIQQIGEECTIVDINRELHRLGYQRTVYSTFLANYRKVFKQDPIGNTIEKGAAEMNGTTIREPLPPASLPLPITQVRIEQSDWIHHFIKFSTAVELLGGTEQARKILDEMDRIKEVLNGDTK